MRIFVWRKQLPAGNRSESLTRYRGGYRVAQKRVKLTLNPIGIHGGAGEDRTRGLLNAIQALSQLSYNPTRSAFAKELCI